MLNATSPETPENKRLKDGEVVAQSLVFLLAGYETSSITLSMTCYHLATNPDVQEKLQREIDGVWTDEDEMPSYETVHELPYLDMVLSENLRLCPPGNGNHISMSSPSSKANNNARVVTVPLLMLIMFNNKQS